MPEGEPNPYIEGTQIIRRTGLTADYMNALGGLAIYLTTWRLGQYEKLGYTEAQMKEKIVGLCKKVEKYEERYANSDLLNHITADNRHLLDDINQRIEQIRAFGNRQSESFTKADQEALDQLIDEVERIITEGKI